MYKTLYISDLDGTLLNSDAELSNYTKAVLAEMTAKGIYFSVATARTAASALKILDGVEWNAPLVLMNGVLIYDTSQKRYTRVFELPAATAAEIARRMKRLGVTGLLYRMVDGEQLTYYEHLSYRPIRDFIEKRVVKYNKIFNQVNSFAEAPLEGAVYFSLMNTESDTRRIYAELEGIKGISRSVYPDNYNEHLWFLEIHSDKVSKRSGVEFLRGQYGFERVVCFGDSLNDLPLMAASDAKIAVANAMPEVKAKADYICGANCEEGVAKWLEENALALNKA